MLLALVLAVCSCSNNVPQVRDARLSIIFDYETMDSLPSARLGVFVESVSNPHRFGLIKVQAQDCDYSWETGDFVMAQNNEQKFCGAVNLVMPQNQKFATGDYNVQFVQDDEEKIEVKLTLDYNTSFYDFKAQEAVDFMNKNMGSRLLKIYDENKKVIYYGPRTPELNDARRIWNLYREAAEFQETWISSSGNVICNLPVEKVTPGN